MPETFPQAFGRYQLKERLALGGMAELFLAEVAGAHGFAKTVVIKRILPHLAADAQFTSMFIAEAKITAQLAHPKIAQTFELGTEHQQLYIVMEYIDGLDVLALLRECAHRRVRVPAELSVYIIKEVLDALDFAHKLVDEASDEPLSIVHRDVSPSNILLSKRGDVKLVDFGIAHAAEQDSQTKAGTLKGKYGYMSPEQVLGHTVSPKSDIFAAGVVLAEMLMGRRLFAAANELDVLLMVRDVDLGRLERFGDHIEPSLANFLRWALRKDPGDRYQDAGVFRDALDEWLFEQRHRITNAQIADIVESLYEDALARRKRGLESNASPPPSPVAVAPAAAPLPQEASAAELEQGVPTGMLNPGGLVLEDEPSAVIEVSPDEDELALAEGASVEPAVAAAAPAQPSAPKDVGDEIINFQLDEEDSGGMDIPIDDSSEVPADAGDPLTASGSLEIDFGSLNDDEDADELARGARDAAPSYDSISAAVASVSPLAPDPSSRDFDDSDVSGVQEARPQRMPTSDELKNSEPATASALSQPDEAAEQHGTLEEFSALGILYRITARRQTGQVVLSFGGVRKEIYLKRGVPEYVASNIASELFGAYLVRKEVISSDELDMSLAVMPHFGGKLGDTLVGLGLMKPLEVFRHLTLQVRSKLIEVCTWTKGEYQWYPNTKCPRQAFPLDLDPLEVYGAGAMESPRASIESWFEPFHGRKLTLARSSIVVPELFQVEGIRKFQESIDGSRTVKEIMTDLSQDDEGLHELRLLYLLLNTGLVEDTDKASESSP